MKDGKPLYVDEAPLRDLFLIEHYGYPESASWDYLSPELQVLQSIKLLLVGSDQ